MKYIIHACNQRMWYVNDFLVPSMLEQGISSDDIQIACDTESKGNLFNTMDIFSSLPLDGDSWHLQDDVLISSKFKEETEKDRPGIVCGICTVYDGEAKTGLVPLENMWWSFPCIKIPNRIAKDCAYWFYNVAVKNKKNKEYQKLIKLKKYDDSFFRFFLNQYYAKIKVTNLDPNIVDHVDYLLGGSAINKTRSQNNVSSVMWDEPELTQALYDKIYEMCLQNNA